MADIFAMDGDIPEILEDPPPDRSLNYRVVEDDNIVDYDESEEDDSVVNELPLPIAIRQTRRNSTATSVPSSLDIDLLSKSFVSAASIKNSNSTSIPYKPKLSDFEPIKVLGKGSYGKVLLVREKSTGLLYAQKQMNKLTLIVDEGGIPSSIENENGKGSGSKINTVNYQRTLNERSILEMVSHPNIVKLYYAFQDNNKVYLILEYLSGGELFGHLSQLNYLNETHASYYIAQIILAIRYLHEKLNVIYRDLKPENCMLNASGNLVLTDFGLSKVSAKDSQNKSMIGTPQYMAPEVLKGESHNYLVDWWSLGCVAFDMLTGSPPFTGNNNKKIMDKIIQSKKFLKFPYYLSNDAKEFLRKVLQSNPDKRLDIDNDFETVKKLRFFRHVNWKQIEEEAHLGASSNVLPPILPLITDPILAENFDAEFTSMTFTPPSSVEKDILHVKGFSYINENYLEMIKSQTSLNSPEPTF
ncbi:serine/threonine-protein kinase Ypk3p [[Candida] railenensis]|uniref:Serine/threonine-protein kinase Ypk3p n=1 Tax=[Candida] railenensis TaxID=45579 RepID=A0A9P0QKK6_9ASCO|nr:serine/threonine-protein kinase Ypk3p [[Candida] railenensis]